MKATGISSRTPDAIIIDGDCGEHPWVERTERKPLNPILLLTNCPSGVEKEPSLHV